MWLNYGKNVNLVQIAIFLSALLWAALGDSPARAGLLKNSVRVGDRSKMTIVGAPEPGQRKRIHITPPAAAPEPARPPAALGWFWQEHTPAAGGSEADRWDGALASVRARREGGEALYAEARLREIAEVYSGPIALAARRHGVSELLLLAVIAVESSGQTKAVSPKGARGLMQLIPATARRFGVADSFNAGENIMGGAAYLNWLLDHFAEDPILALAGYNAGEGAVEAHRGVPPYAETRDYVVRVFDALTAAEPLCKTLVASPRHDCGWAMPAPLLVPASGA